MAGIPRSKGLWEIQGRSLLIKQKVGTCIRCSFFLVFFFFSRALASTVCTRGVKRQLQLNLPVLASFVRWKCLWLWSACTSLPCTVLLQGGSGMLESPLDLMFFSGTCVWWVRRRKYNFGQMLSHFFFLQQLDAKKCRIY